ncbi:hypothetical protein DV736_g5081, partial [Chaetothyriales sp. CBS 134916]
MFRSKTLDVVTLFHKASLPSSTRAANLLKVASANAAEAATESQTTDHKPQPDTAVREPFELEITEAPPTPDQLRSIFEYLGNGHAGQLVKGAATESDALRKLKENGDNFQRPVVVDWNQGKAVAGDNEPEILKLLKALPKNS